MSTHDLGDPVTLDFTVTVAGVPTAPGTIVLTVRDPAGAETTPALTPVSPGVYAPVYSPALAGTYSYGWVTTGAGAGAEYGSFAVRAAFAPRICSLVEVKAQLNKTTTADDAELLGYIDAVTAPIEDFCGAVLPHTVTEWHDAYGSTLWLRSERIASVTSITEYQGITPTVYVEAADPTAAGAYSFFVDPALHGKVERLGSSGYPQPFSGRIKVVYVAGFATIPAALNEAARLIVQTLWRTQNGGAGLPQLSDEPTVDFAGFDAPIPARALMLMSAYKRGPMVA